MSKYRDSILKLITDARPHHISGETIANELNISRMTVKKVIDQLKEEGMSIDSVHNKGHRLNDFPIQWYNGILESLLKDSNLVQKVYSYDSVDSTQQVAKASLMKENGAFLVVSDEQTKGTGRFKRPWQSPKGKGLWMSLVLKPDIPFSMLTTFNLFISLAICETIQSFSEDLVQIKWPNDIYIGKRKVCGFLTEMIANADGIDAIICGIGINVNHNLDDFELPLQSTATSVKLHHHNENINRYRFLKTLLNHIEYRYHQFLTEPFTTIKEEYISSSNIWDRRLRFTEGNRQFYGRVIEIDDQGFLHVIDDAANIHRLMSADIEF
ncbi:biotin--[acetyl-CoA-carboxylase] ligase [Staphylococcus canis]|uniref:Bifunctional ligase/repressor BirA n=1 Tax=Staphylococcus canis TaxID=2724942 RepID=A0ABS0T9D3_9STAP|nr:biotin--[acetyl-CoA-carboxylase] ligase [Staphylococcus canis]MBI5975368.1 biotin--[acetyl-CoA-carboxylase] ligase [Staphylococcus canis]